MYHAHASSCQHPCAPPWVPEQGPRERLALRESPAGGRGAQEGQGVDTPKMHLSAAEGPERGVKKTEERASAEGMKRQREVEAGGRWDAMGQSWQSQDRRGLAQLQAPTPTDAPTTASRCPTSPNLHCAGRWSCTCGWSA